MFLFIPFSAITFVRGIRVKVLTCSGKRNPSTGSRLQSAVCRTGDVGRRKAQPDRRKATAIIAGANFVLKIANSMRFDAKICEVTIVDLLRPVLSSANAIWLTKSELATQLYVAVPMEDSHQLRFWPTRSGCPARKSCALNRLPPSRCKERTRSASAPQATTIPLLSA